MVPASRGTKKIGVPDTRREIPQCLKGQPMKAIALSGLVIVLILAPPHPLHTPTLIRDHTNPPYSNMKGTTHLSTFLGPIATVSVPAGFTPDGLPVGITFFGRAYSEATLIKLAYAYEQSSHHRKPPKTTPTLIFRQ